MAANRRHGPALDRQRDGAGIVEENDHSINVHHRSGEMVMRGILCVGNNRPAGYEEDVAAPSSLPRAGLAGRRECDRAIPTVSRILSGAGMRRAILRRRYQRQGDSVWNSPRHRGRPEIADTTGKVHFFQRKPQIHPEPVLEPDSFADGAGVTIYGTVLRDGGGLRKTMTKESLRVWMIGLSLCTSSVRAEDAATCPVHVFCSTGDHLWVAEKEPVDSPATIEAMFEWMSKTYRVKRMYWQGGQERMWSRHYRFGQANLLAYDCWEWKRKLFDDLKIDEAAVAAARRNGIEMFLYTGLFEHGPQPDVGVIGPYQFEDRLRIDHPQWCPLDRWGERRCPGPISFCYPEARAAIIRRLVSFISKHNYDGVNFYTYVENYGIRYQDEFGFNQPIVDEFNKRYPHVNLRRDTLTEEQRWYWYKCQGRFVTDFFRELHRALARRGKKLSVILDSHEPHYAQPWWGKEIRGTGMVYMDWEAWVDEGIVDELWVQLGDVDDQKSLLDQLLVACKGRPVKLTFRTHRPFASHWAPYVRAGVTPVAVITWENNNGIERYSLEPASVGTLGSPDWKLRLQTLTDIANGALSANAAAVAPLVNDAHVLVRRMAVKALSSLGDTSFVPAIERALHDSESSVRVAAAGALRVVHGPDSVVRELSALEKDGGFQFKMVCVEALSAMKVNSLPAILKGLKSPVQGVREVCVRALYRLGREGMDNEVYDPLCKVMMDSSEAWQVRCWAIDRLTGLRLHWSDLERDQVISDLISITGNGSPIPVQLNAAEGLGHLSAHMTPSQKHRSLTTLQGMFGRYGDRCDRPDAAYGWRVVGNAIVKFGSRGSDILESLHKQTEDKWLAWVAYEVLYVVQTPTEANGGFNLIDEKLAIENHEKYAPAFPGWRKW